jgi:branched-chain amino acid transport system substrate-binding protein
VRKARIVASALMSIVVLAFGASACSEPTKEGAPATGGTTTTVNPAVDDCEDAASIVECAPANSMLTPLMPEVPTKATGEPILIGTINQDTGAAGAFPELTTADKVAIDFINTELNGVDGRPIELVPCNTNFNPDLSQSCAQQMVSRKVVAVIGGIDIWGTGIATLQNNGVPYVGGIPVSFNAARSPASFQFSGGTWGAVLGMGQYAVETLKADNIAIIYAEFGPITDAAELGKRVLEDHGADVTLVSTSPINADMVQALNTAAQSKPDVVIALTADSGCKPTMQTAKQIGFTAPIMYTGACAAPKIIDAVGDAAEGSIFNLEAELDPENGDNVLYQAISKRYGPKYDYEWQGAGTVSFRATINLYAALRKLGAANLTRDAIHAEFRAAREAPSFFGHPYTCDGKQLDGYPAMCAPQQSLGVLKNGAITQLTDWLDVQAFAS